MRAQYIDTYLFGARELDISIYQRFALKLGFPSMSNKSTDIFPITTYIGFNQFQFQPRIVPGCNQSGSL